MQKGQKHSEESKAKMSISHKGVKLSPEHARNSALAHMGLKRSAETKARMSKAREGYKHSPDTLLKLSESHIGNTHTEAAKLKISKALVGNKYRLGHSHSAESKAHLSLTTAQAHADGRIKLPAMYKHPEYISKSGMSYVFRSSWEYKVAVFLDELDIVWYYELDVLILDDTGEAYLPDFFIFDEIGNWVKIIEVKGWFPDKERVRMNKFSDYIPVPLEIWDGKRLKALNLL